MNNKKIVKALGLSSGGLDSILSALILQKQGIDVQWISFKTPFFSPASAIKASKMTGVPLRVEEITHRYMTMLESPYAGYGKNMNPCMDCHSLMFELAGKIMDQEGYDFLFSGEVVGQRPMSQNKNSMNYVEKHSGYKGRILRPLSAKILPATPMEQKGIVTRDALLGISGRSRKIQIQMAKEFGVTDYPEPAGGCLLTDKGFSRRLMDLMQETRRRKAGLECDRKGVIEKSRRDMCESGQVNVIKDSPVMEKLYSRRDLYLLKFGRHFRIDEDIKVVVGKNQADNSKIESMYRQDRDIALGHSELPGPFVLIPWGAFIEKAKINAGISIAGALCAGYTKASPGSSAQIVVRSPEIEQKITVTVPEPGRFRDMML
ncbi:MAG: tRNA 4-thiouridine(8) synthase ThiI [Desulfamplus sp.]|nr:tRNA 4-thiouridine(8) synthase ThiI [Desulfamplus sp.]